MVDGQVALPLKSKQIDEGLRELRRETLKDVHFAADEAIEVHEFMDAEEVPAFSQDPDGGPASILPLIDRVLLFMKMRGGKSL
jgi:hypothetical protein